MPSIHIPTVTSLVRRASILAALGTTGIALASASPASADRVVKCGPNGGRDARPFRAEEVGRARAT